MVSVAGSELPDNVGEEYTQQEEENQEFLSGDGAVSPTESVGVEQDADDGDDGEEHGIANAPGIEYVAPPMRLRPGEIMAHVPDDPQEGIEKAADGTRAQAD